MLFRFPEKQAKLLKTMNNALDEEGAYDDGLIRCSNVPYCQAFVMEVLRYVGQGGCGAVRQAKTDVWTKGFKIPKGVSKA